MVTIRHRLRSIDPWLCALLVMFAIAYRATLLENVGYSGDTAKFQFLGHMTGTGHEPGAPTYLLVLQLFDQLFPAGTPAFKASLLSAILALLTLAMIDRVLRLLDVSRPVAAAGASLFGVVPALWSQAVVAEVYTLHLLFLSIIIWAFLRWRRDGMVRWFLIGCAATAAAFGVHLTTVTILPALIYLVVKTDRSMFSDPHRIGLVLGCILVGASQYLLLFVRAADPSTPYVEMAPTDLSSFWYYITGGQFAGQWYPISVSWFLAARLPIVGSLLWYEMGLFLIPAFFGLFAVRDKVAGLFLALIAAGCIAFAAGYVIPDVFVYFLPVYMVGAVGYAVAGEWFVRRVPDHGRFPVTALIIVLPLIWGARTWPWVDQHHAGTMERCARAALAAVPVNSVLVTPDYDYAGVMWYLTIGEDARAAGRSSLHLHSTSGRESSPHEVALALARYLREGGPLLLPVERRQVAPGSSLFLFQPTMKPAPPRQSRYLARLNPQLYSSTYVRDRRAEWERTLAANGMRLVPATDDLQRIELIER